MDIILTHVPEESLDSFIKATGFDKINLTTENDVDSIIREIQFPPEYQQAGITILSSFGNYIRKKYADQNIKVSIQQEDNKITLIIEGEGGIKEKIVEEMNTYSMVLSGEKSIEELTDNPYEIVELKQQLRIAQLQLQNQRELLALEQRHGEQLSGRSKSIETQYQEMVCVLSTSLKEQTNNSYYLQQILDSAIKTNSKTVSQSLRSLSYLLKFGNYKNHEPQIKKELAVIQQDDPEQFSKFKAFTESCAAGVVGNSMYSWLQVILASLPK